MPQSSRFLCLSGPNGHGSRPGRAARLDPAGGVARLVDECCRALERVVERLPDVLAAPPPVDPYAQLEHQVRTLAGLIRQLAQLQRDVERARR
jgi:hypothetical protein